MYWRRRLIASVRSSRSVVRVVCCASTSRNSSSARKLTAPSRSRRGAPSRAAPRGRDLGQRPPPGLRVRPAPRRSGSRSSICARISCATVAGCTVRGFEPFLGARRLRCALRRTRRARCVPSGRRPRAASHPRRGGHARRAVCALRRLNFEDERAAALRERRRRAVERRTLGLRLAARSPSVPDLADGARLAPDSHSARFGRDTRSRGCARQIGSRATPAPRRALGERRQRIGLGQRRRRALQRPQPVDELR